MYGFLSSAAQKAQCASAHPRGFEDVMRLAESVITTGTNCTGRSMPQLVTYGTQAAFVGSRPMPINKTSTIMQRHQTRARNKPKTTSCKKTERNPMPARKPRRTQKTRTSTIARTNTTTGKKLRWKWRNDIAPKKMSTIERQAALARYLAKRRRRVWTKNLQYESRRRTAFERKRVRGRFVSSV